MCHYNCCRCGNGLLNHRKWSRGRFSADIITSLTVTPAEPPTLDLDFREKLMVKVGDTCMLSGRYSGKPAPAITWAKNDEDLKADEEISLHSTTHHLSLNISKAKREHSGRYCVSVENAAGTRSGICTITVVGESQQRANDLTSCGTNTTQK